MHRRKLPKTSKFKTNKNLTIIYLNRLRLKTLLSFVISRVFMKSNQSFVASKLGFFERDKHFLAVTTVNFRIGNSTDEVPLEHILLFVSATYFFHFLVDIISGYGKTRLFPDKSTKIVKSARLIRDKHFLVKILIQDSKWVP